MDPVVWLRKHLEEGRVAVRDAGDEGTQLHAGRAGRHRGEGAVGLEHRVGDRAHVGDLVVVIHQPEGVEPGGFRGLRDLRDAVEHRRVRDAVEGETGQLQSEPRHPKAPSGRVG